MASYSLPQTKAFVRLSLLDGGSFMADMDKLHANVSSAKFRMYNWAFHIVHNDEHVIWDLGLDGVCIQTCMADRHKLIRCRTALDTRHGSTSSC